MYPNSHIISGFFFLIFLIKTVGGIMSGAPEAGTWSGQALTILTVFVLDLNLRGVFENVKIR